MAKEKRFMGLVLDDDGLHTPDAVMPLAQITRAELVRNLVKTGNADSTVETSMPAVAGGAAAGGVLLGGVGAVAGGLLGSTVKDVEPGGPELRTSEVKLLFETDELQYSLDIPRENESAAERFAGDVRKAMKRNS